MADLIAALSAGLLGGIVSGSLSGVLVFEYETRRERRLVAREAKENAAVVLEQISLLVQGGPRGAVTANRRRALQDVALLQGRGDREVARRLDHSARAAANILKGQHH